MLITKAKDKNRHHCQKRIKLVRLSWEGHSWIWAFRCAKLWIISAAFAVGRTLPLMGNVRQMLFGSEIVSQTSHVTHSTWIYLVYRSNLMLERRKDVGTRPVDLGNCRTCHFPSPLLVLAGGKRQIFLLQDVHRPAPACSVGGTPAHHVSSLSLLYVRTLGSEDHLVLSYWDPPLLPDARTKAISKQPEFGTPAPCSSTQHEFRYK